MKHEPQTAGGTGPVKTATGNGDVGPPGRATAPEVELAEIQILFTRRKLLESAMRRMTLVTTPSGQWIHIVEGSVTRWLSPVGVLMMPKPARKGAVS